MRQAGTSKAIGDLLPNILKQAGAQHATIHQLRHDWAKLAGKTLSAHSKPVSLHQGTLYVHTDEPGTSFALSLKKPALLRRLRTTGIVVREIVIRAGTV